MINYDAFKDLSVPYKELQFKQVVGRGSFGEVYRGEWNGQDVALKRIAIPAGEEKCKMIANSAEIAALKWVHFRIIHFSKHLCLLTIRLLKHPNIVRLLGYSASEKDIVIIMNYIEGKSPHYDFWEGEDYQQGLLQNNNMVLHLIFMYRHLMGKNYI